MIPIGSSSTSIADDEAEYPRNALSSNCISTSNVTEETSLLFQSSQNPLRPLKLTYWDGLSLVVAQQIGSGIFRAPPSINGNVGSVGMSLIVWLIAGCITWCGSCSSRCPFADLACYGELATALSAGGPASFLAYIFDSFPSTLFSWTTILGAKPVSAALLATIFGEYVNRARSSTLHPQERPWEVKMIALLCLWLVVLLNVMSARLSTGLNKVSTTFKLTTLLTIAIIGLAALGIP